MKQFLQNNLPGLLLAFIIAGLAYLLGRLVPVVGGPVFGITLGIIKIRPTAGRDPAGL